MHVIFYILCYLKSALRKGLLFSKHGHLRSEAFKDAGWVGSPNYKRSTFRYYTFVGENLVIWGSKMQSVADQSSVEAEYRVTA